MCLFQPDRSCCYSSFGTNVMWTGWLLWSQIWAPLWGRDVGPLGNSSSHLQVHVHVTNECPSPTPVILSLTLVLHLQSPTADTFQLGPSILRRSKTSGFQGILQPIESSQVLSTWDLDPVSCALLVPSPHLQRLLLQNPAGQKQAWTREFIRLSDFPESSLCALLRAQCQSSLQRPQQGEPPRGKEVPISLQGPHSFRANYLSSGNTTALPTRWNMY